MYINKYIAGEKWNTYLQTFLPDSKVKAFCWKTKQNKTVDKWSRDKFKNSSAIITHITIFQIFMPSSVKSRVSKSLFLLYHFVEQKYLVF